MSCLFVLSIFLVSHSGISAPPSPPFSDTSFSLRKEERVAMAASHNHLSQAFSFLADHPKLSLLVLLLVTASPLLRVLAYFTPLLLTTALCIFAVFTIHPYVTATDAEVEMESRLGSSVYKKRKNSRAMENKAPASEPKVITSTSSRYPVSAHASSFSFSSAPVPPSVSRAVEPSGKRAESSGKSNEVSENNGNTWLSWMKGLNESGRAWVESKLKEQGMALSEPANRDTLLALVQGSFAELVTVQNDSHFSLEEPSEEASGSSLRKETIVTPSNEAPLLGKEVDEVAASSAKPYDGTRKVVRFENVVSINTDVSAEISKASSYESSKVASLEMSKNTSEDAGAIVSIKEDMESFSKKDNDGNSKGTSAPSTPAKLPRKLLEEARQKGTTPSMSCAPVTFGPVVASPEQSESVNSEHESKESKSNYEGPKFDEDADGLEVEEAQALVRSELRMLEMEIDEVAAKLPKLDEYISAYQKTSKSPPSAPGKNPPSSARSIFASSS